MFHLHGFKPQYSVTFFQNIPFCDADKVHKARHRGADNIHIGKVASTPVKRIDCLKYDTALFKHPDSIFDTY